MESLNHAGKIVLQHLHATFDITAIALLNYQGAQVGSEFLTYANSKLYFAVEIEFVDGSVNSGMAYALYYDNLNALFYVYGQNGGYYDGTAAAARYVPNSHVNRNVWFSRVAVGTYDYMRFTGYRITYTP